MTKKLFDTSQIYVIYRKQVRGRWRVYSDEAKEPVLFTHADEAMDQARRLMESGFAVRCRFVGGPSRTEVGELCASAQLSLPGAESWGRNMTG